MMGEKGGSIGRNFRTRIRDLPQDSSTIHASSIFNSGKTHKRGRRLKGESHWADLALATLLRPEISKICKKHSRPHATFLHGVIRSAECDCKI